MNNLISDAIANIASFVKNLRLKQALIVAFSAFFLLASTACSAGSGSYSANANDTGYVGKTGTSVGSHRTTSSSPYDQDTGPKRELYKTTQQKQGGMNNFNDDPQYDRGVSQNKAQRLINNSERNLQNRAGSPKDIIDNVRNNKPEYSNNLGEAVDDFTEGFTEGTRKGVRNLKNNLEKASDNTSDALKQGQRNVKESIRDTKAGAQDLSSSAKRTVNQAADDVVRDR